MPMIMTEEVQHAMHDEVNGMVADALSLVCRFRSDGFACQDHVTKDSRRTWRWLPLSIRIPE